MIMTRNFRKAVNTAINDLDWNLITDFCADGKDRPKISDVKRDMKAIIFTAVQEMLNEGVDEVSIAYFTITIKGDENQHVVSILFTPTKSTAVENPDLSVPKSEIAVLEGLMHNAVREENFELAATLRDRIKRLTGK